MRCVFCPKTCKLPEMAPNSQLNWACNCMGNFSLYRPLFSWKLIFFSNYMRKTWGGCNCNTLQDSYPAISYNCVHMYLMSCINNPWDFFFILEKWKIWADIQRPPIWVSISVLWCHLSFGSVVKQNYEGSGSSLHRLNFS